VFIIIIIPIVINQQITVHVYNSTYCIVDINRIPSLAILPHRLGSDWLIASSTRIPQDILFLSSLHTFVLLSILSFYIIIYIIIDLSYVQYSYNDLLTCTSHTLLSNCCATISLQRRGGGTPDRKKKRGAYVMSGEGDCLRTAPKATFFLPQLHTYVFKTSLYSVSNSGFGGWLCFSPSIMP